MSFLRESSMFSFARPLLNAVLLVWAALFCGPSLAATG